MMSETFPGSLLQGNKIVAPVPVDKSFRIKFPGAINVEWFVVEDVYEAIFYENDTEMICKLGYDGEWIETRTNLDTSFLEMNIKTSAEQYGEIMNSILIESLALKRYELIIRDKQLNRFLLLLDESGEVINVQQII